MINKHYMLDEETVKIIKNTMEEKGLKSEVAAVTYIIKDYQNRESLADEVVEKFNETNKAWMERIRWASKTAEQNSQVSLDVLNTLLYELKTDEVCIYAESAKHPVIEQSENRLKERIAHFKQTKDNRKRKEHI